jgi:hypothetical protein
VKYQRAGWSAVPGCRLAARHAGRHRPPRDRRADEHGAEEREQVRPDVVDQDIGLRALGRCGALVDGCGFISRAAERPHGLLGHEFCWPSRLSTCSRFSAA